jgi:pyruvate, orthophosphate dikinase
MSDLHFIGGRQSDAALTAALVGNKAANLARLDALGLRVPPAVALDTSVCQAFMAAGALSDDLVTRLAAAIRQIEQATGLTLGGRQPLLLSVRSSPPASMPGMLETVLNVGLAEQTVPGLIRRTGNPWLAWDAYRRAVRSIGEVVHGLEPGLFDAAEARRLAADGARSIDELDPLSLRDLAREQADLLRLHVRERLPQEPLRQVVAAVEAVLRSWTAPKAGAYRRVNGIADDTGTGVVIQAMVFGNAGPRSGSGVGFTRNPATGEDELYMDFVFNAQGEDVVAGRNTVGDSALLPQVLPQVCAELQTARRLLESEFRDMQDFEFTVDEGQLFFLQTRDAKRTPWAALQVAVDLVRGGVIDVPTALVRLAGYDLPSITRTSVPAGASATCLAKGTGAAPGVVSGTPVVSAGRAQQLGPTAPVIMVRPEVTTDDFPGLSVAAGMLTAVGGRTSHAAVVARQLSKPCIVGCAPLRVDEVAHACTIGDRTFHEGDVITIDGDTGCVYAGVVPMVIERPDALLAVVEGWQAVAPS